MFDWFFIFVDRLLVVLFVFVWQMSGRFLIALWQIFDRFGIDIWQIVYRCWTDVWFLLDYWSICFNSFFDRFVDRLFLIDVFPPRLFLLRASVLAPRKTHKVNNTTHDATRFSSFCCDQQCSNTCRVSTPISKKK